MPEDDCIECGAIGVEKCSTHCAAMPDDLDLETEMQAGEEAALASWQEILAFRRLESEADPRDDWTLPEQQRLKGTVLNRLAQLDKFGETA